MKVQVCEAAGKNKQQHHQHLLYHTTIMAMKRKLNSDDVPEVVVPEAGEAQTTTTPAKATFDSLNLDSRILQAITREKFTEPTPVQAATLPLALSGKDILGMFGIFLAASYAETNISQPAQRPAPARLWPTSSQSSTPSSAARPPPQDLQRPSQPSSWCPRKSLRPKSHPPSRHSQLSAPKKFAPKT